VAERERAIGVEHTISETANTASATATEAKTLVTELGTTVGTLSTDLTETETNLDALTTTVNSNKAEANTKFAELTTDINANTTAITNLTESLSTEVTNRTNKDTELDGKIELVKSTLTVESNRAQAAEARIETKVDNLATSTEHNISDALQEAKTYTDQSINTVETEISNLTDEVNENKFKTKDTNTVHLALDKQTGEDEKTLTADVKIKTIEGLDVANIIKSDTNGIYATVNLSYNKAENKLTFNDGNGDKVFELNNFGILQDGYYDSENKKIVLIVKKDDQTTDRIEIPVGDLVDTWTVENPSDSPIRLTKTTVAGEGDVLTADIIVQDPIDSPVTLTKAGGILSSNLRILDNEHNLLTKENGALFADNDANAHFTNFRGSATSVTNAIQILDGDVVNALNKANQALEKANQALEEVGEFDERIDEALEKSNQALEKANQALELASGFDARITAIEEWISNAIDLGTYPNTQNGGGE
jgi:predicted  nucleic acid-binding Zn-ribbon protein